MAQSLINILKPIVSAAASELTAQGAPAGLVIVAPGSSVAFDNCCDSEGQLWVRVVSTQVLDNGQPRGHGRSCDTLFASELGLGVIRCAHTLNDHGVFPTADEITSDAEVMMADMASLAQVIQCDVPEIAGVMKSELDRWFPQGPEGGCVGGEWRFQVVWDPCLCR